MAHTRVCVYIYIYIYIYIDIYIDINIQGSTLRKSPVGLVIITFTSPDSILLALKIDDICAIHL